jgi:Putative auto-transporter adhesin, head GIN domain
MRIQSVLIGAAVAALVIVPSDAADPGWITGQWKTYDAHALKLDSVVGNVRVDVKDSGPIAIQINGAPERVNKVHIDLRGGTLVVSGEAVGTVWDWRHWFDFSRVNVNKPSQLMIHVAVPRGSDVDVDETAGNVTIGNTMGKLKFSVQGHTESSVGNVTEADLDMAGSGKLTVGNVSGPAKVDTAGSGNIRIGDVGKASADIAGSGSITFGNIRDGVDVDIAGSGDFSAASVHGPTRASIAGSGSVTIAGGEADPLHVEIMGSGNVSFGGVAVNPHIEAMGSGSVRIKSYRGTLQNDGMAKINVGG